MKTVELKVDGLCCADCAIKVEKVLKAAKGVKDIKTLLSAEKAVVTYDEAEVKPEEIIKRIEGIGYKVRSQESVVACLCYGRQGSQELSKKRDLADTLRFAFITAIGIIALAEIGLEYFGFLEKGLELIPLPVTLIAILLGGYPIFKKAFLGLLNKQINVDLMMSVGIIGAAAIGEFTSSMLVVFFMNLAHYLEEFTVTRSRQTIKELIKLAPKTARIKVDGREIEVDVTELKSGDIVAARPGEKISVDGIVIKGLSSVNQASITGESMPIEKGIGDEVFAATLNENGYLEIRTTKVGEDTTLGKIIKLVEEAEAHKAPVQKFADRFTTYFLPSAVSLAILTYLISGKAIYAIAVLVAACPCAVGLATPLSVIASVGSSARRGLLIKGGLYLEALAKVDCVVMDKTGTVTFGKPQVTDIVAVSSQQSAVSKEDILRLAVSVERHSEHAIASAIIEKAKKEGIEIPESEGFEYLIGKGIKGKVEGKTIILGNQKLLEEKEITIFKDIMTKAEELEKEGKTVLFLAIPSPSLTPTLSHRERERGARGEGVIGIIAVADVLRDEVPKAIEDLKKIGIKRLILLTGDNERVASSVVNKLGITEYRANCLPQDKIEIVKRLQDDGHKVCMIGDGVNDAPTLAQADVGIAMGVAGTDVAMEAAHVALMRDDWSQVPHAVKVGRNTYKIIRQGIALGISWDVITMGLASIGILSPVMAAALEELPTLVVAANASRLLVNDSMMLRHKT
ncbi:MAG: cation-translocating P-type ATPase [Nitrospinae bacterium]|nr:cation-translocating P-type ATPase [Nitrospinota bacterium]